MEHATFCRQSFYSTTSGSTMRKGHLNHHYSCLQKLLFSPTVENRILCAVCRAIDLAHCQMLTFLSKLKPLYPHEQYQRGTKMLQDQIGTKSLAQFYQRPMEGVPMTCCHQPCCNRAATGSQQRFGLIRILHWSRQGGGRDGSWQKRHTPDPSLNHTRSTHLHPFCPWNYTRKIAGISLIQPIGGEAIGK